MSADASLKCLYMQYICGVYMVNAMINISRRANRVLGIVKAKYGLRRKSQAIDRMAQEYEEQILEPQLRPEVVKEIINLRKHGTARRIKSIREIFQ